MKRVILIFTLLLTTITFAQSKNAKANIHGKSIKALTNRLCNDIENIHNRQKAAQHVEDLFLKFLNLTRATPNYKEIIHKFWNENYSEFICIDSVIGSPVPRHFLKRVMDIAAHHQIFKKFLLPMAEDLEDATSADELISMNVTEINSKGEQETVLDYIQGIIDDKSLKGLYDKEELKKLILILKDYGAKYAGEL